MPSGFYNPLTGLWEQPGLDQLGAGGVYITAFGIQVIGCEDAAALLTLLGISAGSVLSVSVTSLSSGLTANSVGSAANPAFTLTLDATLQALSQASVTADTIIYGSGVDQVSTTAFTAAARQLLDDTTAAAQRTTLGGTTIGQAIFTLTNPSQVGFIRTDVANTVTPRTAAQTRTDLSLVIGTNVQAWSATLDDFVGIATIAGGDLSLSGALAVTGQVTSDVGFLGAHSALDTTALIDLMTAAVHTFRVLDNGKMALNADVSAAGNVIQVTYNSSDIFTLDVDGVALFSGLVTATGGFDGSGAALTALNATQLTSGTVPSARLAGAYTGITQVGTLAAGTWNASIIAGQYGGTGVNNSSKTITLGGSFATSGAFTVTLTVGANTNVTLPSSGTLYGTATGSITSAQLAGSLTDETGSGAAVFGTSPTLTSPTIANLNLDKTITGSGNTGNQTINKTSGSVRFAAGATSLTLTNSLATSTSVCNATVGSNDADMYSVQAVCGTGSVVFFAKPTDPAAECIVYWELTN